MSVRLTRKIATENQQPVIAPFQMTGPVSFRGSEINGNQPNVVENPSDREDLPPFSAVHLPVINVGLGPALNIGGEFSGPRGVGGVRYPTEALRAGDVGVIVFENWNGDSLAWTGNDYSVSVSLSYTDIAGNVYGTQIEFVVGDNAYRYALRTHNGP